MSTVICLKTCTTARQNKNLSCLSCLTIKDWPKKTLFNKHSPKVYFSLSPKDALSQGKFFLGSFKAPGASNLLLKGFFSGI